MSSIYESDAPMPARPRLALRWPRAHGRLSRARTLALGGALLLIAFMVGSASGAYGIAPARIAQVVWEAALGAQSPQADHLVFFNIRLPRLLMGVAAGAGLGLAGAMLQGLFRNPLADPGLIGVSSGAALAAGATIVLAMCGFLNCRARWEAGRWWSWRLVAVWRSPC